MSTALTPMERSLLDRMTELETEMRRRDAARAEEMASLEASVIRLIARLDEFSGS